MKTIRIKEWFLDKTQQVAKTYNCFIDTPERGEHGLAVVDENGTVAVIVEEELSESEKAVKVRLATGSIVGSVKGWTTWIPKSVIA